MPGRSEGTQGLGYGRTPLPDGGSGGAGRPPGPAGHDPMTVSESIQILGARQNNLAGVNVTIPRGRLVAITGVSGSGKSSLAFDTLFREGQRRFLETLSAYARQFLGRMEKPDVDSIEGLSAAIAVDQKSIQRGSRSTVGTLTEIVDHLRVLYARAGRPHCPECRLPIRSQTPEAICQQILARYAGEPLLLLAPLVRDKKGHHRTLLAELAAKGFVRARVDGQVLRIEDAPELARYVRHTIEAVVDRLKPDPEKPDRLREALHQALELGAGDLVVAAPDGDQRFSTSRTCPGCGGEVPPLEPRLFSFNSPHGACPTCEGLGFVREPSEEALIADPALTIRAGALAVTRASGGALLFPRVEFAFLEQVAAAHGFDLDTPWEELPAKARRVILHGAGEARFEDQASWNGKRWQGNVVWKRKYRGVIPALLRGQDRGALQRLARRHLEEVPCPDCEGVRLNGAARAVLLGAMPLESLLRAPISALPALLADLELSEREARIARDLLAEIQRRVDFLLSLGLEYLTLERPADTLSGGEAQRIRLAAQLGAGLAGVLYVLDEPSIGLHWRDQTRLIGALRRLADGGNTVVVVEHDEATLRAADWLIDVGPGAGRAGGRIVAAGPPADVARSDTQTARLLRGEVRVAAPERRRPGNGNELLVRGARAFNLKDIDVRLPLGTLIAVTGVSGSGKSTLVQRVLRRALERHLGREAPTPGKHRRIEGLEHVEELVAIDAAPIGRTPRSNPATYTGVLSPIRDLFAGLPESRMRGYTKSRFSFNVAGGRCEACGGAGATEVELQFLAPVTVPCEECGGHRFQEDTLEARYKGRSIADVLAATVDEALELFADHPKIAHPLRLLAEVGLGYLTLGQPSTTLSGGEAQRIKLVTHLARRTRKHTLYLLDEPTTGLHLADVERLVSALQRLVDQGHTVLVVEHELDLIQAADFVVDLGPEAGAAGGELVVAGTPEQVAACPRSHTGAALRALLAGRGPLAKGKAQAPPAPPPTHIRVLGARTHNLREVSLDIPRDALTVITGVSGSGKSSLALDTIHTEGRRRFVESLSTYARQFLGSQDRPPVERIDGLGPSVAVEARGAGGGPRSSVATTTEIHDHLRVLWARAGTPRCPEHGQALERADPAGVARRVVKELDGARGWILAPILGPGFESPDDPRAALAERLELWHGAGFVRALADGVEVRLDGPLPELRPGCEFELVVDRVRFDAAARTRIAEAVQQAEALTGGRIRVQTQAGERREYATRGVCSQCGFHLPQEPEPRHFSFNTHVGACVTCDGLGVVVAADPELLIDAPERSLVDGAIAGKLGRYLTKGKGFYEMLLREVAAAHRIDIEKPFAKLTERQRELLLFGKGARAEYRVVMTKEHRNASIEERFSSDWTGLCGHVDAWHQRADDPEWAAILEGVMSQRTCRTCEGERLQPAWRAVTVGKKRLPEVLSATVEEVLAWLAGLKLNAARRAAVEAVLAELRGRLELLQRVGLGYLSLSRPTSTLSGGEVRRVRLSASLGSHLVGVCYVLDEPTVGLHPADVERLGDALLELRDRGNTVLVVEHDEVLMRRADHLVDMGPGAGRLGGEVVASGTPAQVERHPTSLTARALRGELGLARGTRGEPRLVARLSGARTHNLRGVDLELRLGEFLGLCGPSGSGKSSLVLDTLLPALAGEEAQGRWADLELPHGPVRTVLVDASPVGRTPASVPATYSGLLDPLRELFARTPEARAAGFGPAHFSFNSPRGRCPACEGLGATKVEMQFLPDLWLVCEECDGERYRPEVRAIRYRGRSLPEILALSVDEASELLEHQPQAAQILASLRAVGLGYLVLGQSSTTLSGGEAQRLKLAAELVAVRGAASLVLLDEPTTGLHAADVVHLARVLDALVERGNGVVVIEHHTELLGLCDRLVELGPGGGGAGGRVIAAGTPAELALDPRSITGPFLPRNAAPAVAPARAAANPTGAARRPRSTRA